MNALPSPPSSPSARLQRKTSRQALRQNSRRTKSPYRIVAIEVGAKLGVNLLLAIAAGVALVRLVPYNISQQAKLAELQAETNRAEERVNLLQESFNRYFDPYQVNIIMQEESNRISENQRRIIFLQPEQPLPPAP
jgi:cell division protein FtsB